MRRESYLITVVISTYHRTLPLQNALRSLTEQTMQDFEVLIVDDNADAEWNRRVREIVESFAETEQGRFKLIVSKKNLGSAEARNMGVKQAKGEYITFLDDDDLYAKDKIERQYQVIKAENADYCLCDMELYSDDEKLIECRDRRYLCKPEGKDLLCCHMKYHMCGTSTLMFRTNYLKMIGSFGKIAYGDEFYTVLRAIEAGGKLAYLEGYYVKAYVHTQDMGMSSANARIEGEKRLYKMKQLYFSRMKRWDVRYVTARHYAVLAMIYRSHGNWGKFFFSGVRAFAATPLGSIRILLGER